MRLVTYSTGGGQRAGIVIDGKVVDLAPAGYSDVVSFLADGDKAIAAASSLSASADACRDAKEWAP